MKKIFTLLVAALAFVGVHAAEKTIWEGTYSDGIEISSETISTFKVGDVLRVYVTVPENGANFKILYKGEANGWEETVIPSIDSQWPWVNGGETYKEFALTQNDLTAMTGMNIYIYKGENSVVTKVTLITADDAPVAQGERTVWEGNEAISWNTEVAPGTQYETPEGIFAGLEKGNVIRLYTTTTYDEPQYVITYKKGDSWEWTDLSINVSEGVISYTVADETTATEIADRGLIIRGQAYTITKITIESETEQPVEGEQTVWEGSEAISWNTEVAPGTQFETPEGIFAGLEKGNVIRVYTTTTYDEPQYVITYKKGDSWEWTDLETTIANGVISYTVADETTATEIADRGIIVRGQAYTITKITVTKDDTATVIGQRNILSQDDNHLYNLRGQLVIGLPQKGIYVRNGRKIVVR